MHHKWSVAILATMALVMMRKRVAPPDVIVAPYSPLLSSSAERNYQQRHPATTPIPPPYYECSLSQHTL